MTTMYSNHIGRHKKLTTTRAPIASHQDRRRDGAQSR